MSGLALPPGAQPSSQSAPHQPQKDDFLPRACPFTSGSVALPVGPQQISVGATYTACHRRCALFQFDPGPNSKKGRCAIVNTAKHMAMLRGVVDSLVNEVDVLRLQVSADLDTVRAQIAQGQFPNMEAGLEAVKQIEERLEKDASVGENGEPKEDSNG